jgi:hypothetical protein
MKKLWAAAEAEAGPEAEAEAEAAEMGLRRACRKLLAPT